MDRRTYIRLPSDRSTKGQIYPLHGDSAAGFSAVHDDGGAEAFDVGVVEEQTMGEGLEIIHVTGERYDGEVGLAGNVITLLDLRLGAHLAPEGIELVQALALQFDEDDEGHGEAEGGGRQDRRFTRDQSAVAHGLDAALHRGDGQPGLFGDGLKPGTGVSLQDAQNGKIGVGHVSHEVFVAEFPKF